MEGFHIFQTKLICFVSKESSETCVDQLFQSIWNAFCPCFVFRYYTFVCCLNWISFKIFFFKFWIVYAACKEQLFNNVAGNKTIIIVYNCVITNKSIEQYISGLNFIRCNITRKFYWFLLFFVLSLMWDWLQYIYDSYMSCYITHVLTNGFCKVKCLYWFCQTFLCLIR